MEMRYCFQISSATGTLCGNRREESFFIGGRMAFSVEEISF